MAQEIHHLVPNKLFLEQAVTSPDPSMQHRPGLLSPSNMTTKFPDCDPVLIQCWGRQTCKLALNPALGSPALSLVTQINPTAA